jgi:hypothetical protein
MKFGMTDIERRLRTAEFDMFKQSPTKNTHTHAHKSAQFTFFSVSASITGSRGANGNEVIAS